MISKLSIKNFRSIIDSKVDLTDLTVIVGANSTGKSNLIKAIEFISDLCKYGITESVYKRGGFSEILPKQVKSIYNNNVEFSIELEVEPPENWIKLNLPKLQIEYDFCLSFSRKNKVVIKSENLIINNFSLLSYFIINKFYNEENLDSFDVDYSKSLLDSKIEFSRNNRHRIVSTIYQGNSKIDPNLLLEWIGIKDLLKSTSEEITKLTQVKMILNNLINRVNPNYSINQELIISSKRALCNFSKPLRNILQELQSYGRYDLLISELRVEQSVSRSKKISSTGDNLPSIVKDFVNNHEEKWERIVSTMSNISPYFENVHSDNLRTGKEFLLFDEIFKGRGIESWEASDGTLRALAILMVVESHPEGSTILIEEPEHGLHPWAINDLMEHFYASLQNRHVQIIITTHSQQVLECIKKSELLITERDENGSHFYKIDEILSNADITIGEIGEMWTRGLLKGVPESI